MAEALDLADLDEDEKAALKEAKQKGYYHNRPKSEPQAFSPQKLDGGKGATDERKSRTDHDDFQKKWDKFDGDEDEIAEGLRARNIAAGEDADEPPKPKMTKEERAKKLNRMQRMQKAKEDDEAAERRRARKSFCFLIFMFGGGALTVIGTIYSSVLGNGVDNIDVDNTPKLKEVLFGGEPWLIYCVNEKTAKYPLPAVLEKHAWDVRGSLGISVGVMDCEKPTESGRSISQKYKFGVSSGFAFAIANGEKPSVINLNGVSDAEGLEKQVKPVLHVGISKVEKLDQFAPRCSGRRACLIIGHKTKDAKEAATKIIKPALQVSGGRGVKAITLDTSLWGLKLGDSMLQARGTKAKADKDRVDVLCLARPDGYVDRSENDTHRGAWFNEELEEYQLGQFIKACNKHQNLVSWGVEPKIVFKEKKPKKKKPAANPAPKPPSPSPSPSPSSSPSSAPKPPSPRPKKQEKVEEVPDDIVDTEDEYDDTEDEVVEM